MCRMPGGDDESVLSATEKKNARCVYGRFSRRLQTSANRADAHAEWGYYPSGGLGLAALIILILLLLGVV